MRVLRAQGPGGSLTKRGEGTRRSGSHLSPTGPLHVGPGGAWVPSLDGDKCPTMGVTKSDTSQGSWPAPVTRN